MDAWGFSRAVLASVAPASQGTHAPQRRRLGQPPPLQLPDVRQACHVAQLRVEDGLRQLRLEEGLRCIPGLLAQPPPAEQADAADVWRGAQRAALAFLASLCLHLGGSSAAHAINVPSAVEDGLLEVERVLEAKLDTAARFAGEALSTLPGLPGLQGIVAPQQSSEEWQALVTDVWEVVDSNFLDARGGGFSREAWRRQLDDALARPLDSRAAAYGAIRDMLRTLRDPYSRFVSPQEFSAMLKYDVSGVGLNLGTAEEFVNKTGLALPGYSPEAAAPAGEPSSSSSGSSSSGSSGVDGDGGGIYVLGLISGSAADAAGIQQGDQLLSVAGRSLSGQTPFQVASLLADGQGEGEDGGGTGGAEAGAAGGEQQQGLAESLGLAGRAVTLQVKKFETQEVVEVSLERPVRVVPTPVTARLERPSALPFQLPSLPALPSSAGSSSGSSSSSSEGAVGYIRLSSFNARAQRDLAAAVRRLEAEGATRLVLDLRDNRGGLVSEGVEAARLFLEGDALVVQPTGKAKATAMPITAAGPALTSAPLVVLVNEHTASASEILAGALQDNCRAVLAGRQTYGKGLIQSVYELGDGSGLVLTVGKYMTPRGTDIDREGIRPQFRSMPSPDAAEQALRACRLAPAGQRLPPLRN